MSDNFYVVVKLTSGEQVLATLREEDENYILLEDPMCIRMVPLMEIGREQVMATPFCHFSDDQTYIISKRNVMFVKRLHASFVPHYKKFVKEHKETAFVPKEENLAEDLQWDDEPPTPEEARKMQRMLKDVLGEEEEEIDWKEKLKNLVPGNDTLN